MEIYKNINLGYILKITGNSRFRVLNDYENKLIDEKYIKCKYDNVYLEVTNPRNCFISDKKFQMKFEYTNGNPPAICGVWDYKEFIPSHVIYPINMISNDTSVKFNIYPTIEEEIINDSHPETYETKRPTVHAPNIVNKYGNIVDLFEYEYELYEEYSDYTSESD